MKDAAPNWSWTGSQLLVVMKPRPNCENAAEAPSKTLNVIPMMIATVPSAASRVMP
jgi:hypothetical protein